MRNSLLLVNLVFALIAAITGALIATRLGQSVILGYIAAGIVIGPFTPGFTGDPATVQALADIGAVFLMFAIGVELSLRDLVRVGKVATIGAAVQILLMTGIGYLVGTMLGWPPLEAFVFGAVISSSSSIVFGKLLAEQGQSDAQYGRIALAWSSIQDLTTIVFVVLISALAQGGDHLLADIAFALGKASVFLVILTTLGSFVLPRIFERVAALDSREVFILVTAAVALGMAYSASFFGLSLALGAFVAGIVVSESDVSHHILGEVMPLRDIFAAIFFVSVGMLVDPTFALHNLHLVLLTTLLIVVVKGTISAGITLLLGYSVGISILTGIMLGQSAEFAFLLASVGMNVGAVSVESFRLLLAGTALSILMIPPLYKVSPYLIRWAERVLPAPALSFFPDGEDTIKRPTRRHAVICGYGRVGLVIGTALERRGFPFTVIEEQPEVVRSLRQRGIPALLGNASNPVLLERAGLQNARVLLVAVPDPLAGRLIVDYARRINPELDIAARTHSWSDRDFMLLRRVDKVVMGELEIALELTDYALHRFGVSRGEIQAILQGMRNRLDLERPETLLDVAE